MNITELKKTIREYSPLEGLKIIEQYRHSLNIDKLEQTLLKEEERLKSISSIEKSLYNQEFNTIAGVDEVGRGPLAGPVVSACVVLEKNYKIFGINDSKKVNEKNREILSKIIKRDALSYGISVIDNNIIDNINILKATKLSMLNCIKDININIDCVLIDALNLEKLDIKQISIIKGDEKSISIAAASIIAKVYRDNLMIEYDKIYPEYNFKQNKGYGTQEHILAIKKYGYTKIHRRTFIKNIV